MGVILGLLWPVERFNDLALWLGRRLAIAGLAAMVAVTLLQVFCRYVLNAALPWPDEAARFAMLWLTGLIAPDAWRRGGFVAIETLPRALTPTLAAVLNLCLLGLAGLVLVVGARIGWAEVTGFGGRFATASLWLPWPGTDTGWFRVPRSWMMASLLVGIWGMLAVTVELMLRAILGLAGRAGALRPLSAPAQELSAE